MGTRVTADVEPILELVRAWSPKAQLVVVHRGDTLIDLAHGVPPDALFWLFSTSKPFASVILWRLVERGLVDVERPVAEYWPEYAQAGKHRITVRQVLQHRTGVATAGKAIGDILAMPTYDGMLRRIVRTAPRFDPADGPSYQYLVYAYILAEIARRVTGAPYRELLHDELLAPLGMRDTHLGLDAATLSRGVPLRSPWYESSAHRYLNSKTIRQAMIPSAGVSTSARELATFYGALLSDAHGDGPGILRPATLARATEPSSIGQSDQFLRQVVHWSNGFQVGGRHDDPRHPDGYAPFGRTSSLRAFGHNGSYSTMAWADPDRELVVAYTTDRLPPRGSARAHFSNLSDAILRMADQR